MLAEGRVGLISAADAAKEPLRLDKTGAVVVSQGHPSNWEMASRGKLFIVSTAVAGVAPGTALSTTPPMCLWNPNNSGKDLCIEATHLGYVSGTLGAGSVVYAQVAVQATAPTGGTELTPISTKLGAVRGTGRAFQASTVVSTPTIVRPAYIIGAFLATTALIPGLLRDDVDGAIVVPPATAFVIQGVAAAGTSPLVLLSITWEEIDHV